MVAPRDAKSNTNHSEFDRDGIAIFNPAKYYETEEKQHKKLYYLLARAIIENADEIAVTFDFCGDFTDPRKPIRIEPKKLAENQISAELEFAFLPPLKFREVRANDTRQRLFREERSGTVTPERQVEIDKEYSRLKSDEETVTLFMDEMIWRADKIEEAITEIENEGDPALRRQIADTVTPYCLTDFRRSRDLELVTTDPLKRLKERRPVIFINPVPICSAKVVQIGKFYFAFEFQERQTTIKHIYDYVANFCGKIENQNVDEVDKDELIQHLENLSSIYYRASNSPYTDGGYLGTFIDHILQHADIDFASRVAEVDSLTINPDHIEKLRDNSVDFVFEEKKASKHGKELLDNISNTDYLEQINDRPLLCLLGCYRFLQFVIEGRKKSDFRFDQTEIYYIVRAFFKIAENNKDIRDSEYQKLVSTLKGAATRGLVPIRLEINGSRFIGSDACRLFPRELRFIVDKICSMPYQPSIFGDMTRFVGKGKKATNLIAQCLDPTILALINIAYVAYVRYKGIAIIDYRTQEGKETQFERDGYRRKRYDPLLLDPDLSTAQLTKDKDRNVGTNEREVLNLVSVFMTGAQQHKLLYEDLSVIDEYLTTLMTKEDREILKGFGYPQPKDILKSGYPIYVRWEMPYFPNYKSRYVIEQKTGRLFVCNEQGLCKPIMERNELEKLLEANGLKHLLTMPLSKKQYDREFDEYLVDKTKLQFTTLFALECAFLEKGGERVCEVHNKSALELYRAYIAVEKGQMKGEHFLRTLARIGLPAAVDLYPSHELYNPDIGRIPPQRMLVIKFMELVEKSPPTFAAQENAAVSYQDVVAAGPKLELESQPVKTEETSRLDHKSQPYDKKQGEAQLAEPKEVKQQLVPQIKFLCGDTEIGKQLFNACRTGDVAIVREILSKNLNYLEGIENIKDSRNPLITAIISSSKNSQALEVVKVLIQEFKADINASASHGISALHHAVQTGNFEAVKLLVQSGANLQIKDERGVTPVWYALSQKGNTDNHKHIFDFLVRRGAFDKTKYENPENLNALSRYFNDESFEMVKTIFEHHLDPNKKDKYGRNILMMLLANGKSIKYIRHFFRDAHLQDSDNSQQNILQIAFQGTSWVGIIFLLENAVASMRAGAGFEELRRVIINPSQLLVENILRVDKILGIGQAKITGNTLLHLITSNSTLWKSGNIKDQETTNDPWINTKVFNALLNKILTESPEALCPQNHHQKDTPLHNILRLITSHRVESYEETLEIVFKALKAMNNQQRKNLLCAKNSLGETPIEIALKGMRRELLLKLYGFYQEEQCFGNICDANGIPLRIAMAKHLFEVDKVRRFFIPYVIAPIVGGNDRLGNAIYESMLRDKEASYYGYRSVKNQKPSSNNDQKGSAEVKAEVKVEGNAEVKAVPPNRMGLFKPRVDFFKVAGQKSREEKAALMREFFDLASGQQSMATLWLVKIVAKILADFGIDRRMCRYLKVGPGRGNPYLGWTIEKSLKDNWQANLKHIEKAERFIIFPLPTLFLNHAVLVLVDKHEKTITCVDPQMNSNGAEQEALGKLRELINSRTFTYFNNYRLVPPPEACRQAPQQPADNDNDCGIFYIENALGLIFGKLGIRYESHSVDMEIELNKNINNPKDFSPPPARVLQLLRLGVFQTLQEVNKDLAAKAARPRANR